MSARKYLTESIVQNPSRLSIVMEWRSLAVKLRVQHGGDWVRGAQVLLDEERDFLGTNPPVPDPLRHHQDHRAVTTLPQTAAANNLNT